jgi:hypothetical protein
VAGTVAATTAKTQKSTQETKIFFIKTIGQ